MNRIINLDGTWHRRNGVSGSNAGILPWTPADTSTAVWYDASDASTITISTGVSEWRDKSGNGNHASQATSGNQPAYITNGWAKKNVISFDGNDNLTHTYANPTTNISIFMVLNRLIEDSTFSNRYLYATSGATTTQSNIYSRSSSVVSWGTLGSSSTNRNAQSTIVEAGWVQIGFVRTTSGTFYFNGVSDGTFATDSVGLSTGTIAGTTGRIAEVIVIDTNVSLELRQNIEGYLAHKWDLTNRLPLTHPYLRFQPSI